MVGGVDMAEVVVVVVGGVLGDCEAVRGDGVRLVEVRMCLEEVCGAKLRMTVCEREVGRACCPGDPVTTAA